jgi:Skp family chaperone for outer membrane proteins
MKKGIRLIALVVIFVMSMAVAGYAQEQKIGFVDRRTIAFEYNKIKDLNAAIEKEYEAARQEIESKTSAIRKLSEEMELLSESARQEKEPELQEQIRAFDNFRREKMQELGKKRDEGMMTITQEIEEVSKEEVANYQAAKDTPDPNNIIPNDSEEMARRVMNPLQWMYEKFGKKR